MKKVLAKSRRKWWKGEYKGTIYRYPDGEIVCDDALHLLNEIQDECADVVFLDPPFNLGKEYGKRSKKEDNIEEFKYIEYMTKVLKRGIQILKPGGALYVYHIPRFAIKVGNILNEQGMIFRHWIAIGMKNSFARGNYLHPAHYALLYYTKGIPANFTRPKIPVAKCKYCGKEIKDYGGYKKYVLNGLNLSDFWEDISPVRHKKFKHRQGNELSIKIVSRVMDISGVKGGLVVDPFAGTGSALVAARICNMRFVGGDIEEEFMDVMDARLSKTFQAIS